MFAFIGKKIVDLFPGYFSMVMATGALSIISFQLDIPIIPQLLLYFNLITYGYLWILTLLRIIKYFPRVISDMTSHTLGPGFFTFVAGTSVLGSQLIVISKSYILATFLFYLAIVLWGLIMYTFFTAVTVRKNKPSLAEGINGAWLIASVATQSISVLGTLLSPMVQNGRDFLLFFTLCMYLLGCMLYLNIITLIFYRFTFIELQHAALTPPYWINMGAVAITTLAGSTLLLHAQNWPLLIELAPFIKGFTLFFWITSTWWIPLLFILMIWRHIFHRYPFTYNPQYWGMVFPLAMYSTGTFQLSKALQTPFLIYIPQVMIIFAFAAWLSVFVGFIKHQIRTYHG